MLGRRQNLEKIICDWLSRVLCEPTNDSTVAYCVNLYDSPFRADIVGLARFDAQDEDWACEEVWSPRDRSIDLPEKYAALPWEERLDLCTDILRRFISSTGPGARILREADAVAVGFVDGNLNIVHQRRSQ